MIAPLSLSRRQGAITAMDNLFNDMVTISRIRAQALTYEAGLYRKASDHEEAKDILWPKEEDQNDEEKG